MKELIQTTRYNCWETALKCVLNDPPDFPCQNVHLTLEEAEKDWSDYHCRVMNWLNARNIRLVIFTKLNEAYLLKGLHLISGKSPRGVLHTVVGRAGEIIHDPWYGDDKGFVDPSSEWEFEIFMLKDAGLLFPG